ncbi:MAG: hypothetical protein IPO83_00115 [Chitinophagaceae bacterium]|nr:hypothetical protein [Chitinophagaceae bacterium]
MKKTIRWLNYVNAPIIKENAEQHLMMVSIRNKVWNPVFIVGTITFVCSMLFRGFLDATFAVIPLALSTIILFAGVWILSANGMVVFDKRDSNCYCIYKHLGYLQKIYSYPLTSIDSILMKKHQAEYFSLYLLKDDGILVKIAESKNKETLSILSTEISLFLKIPLEI